MTNKTHDPREYVMVPIPAKLHNELVLRRRSPESVQHYIEGALERFLEWSHPREHLSHIPGMWDDSWEQEQHEDIWNEAEWIKKVGPQSEGYQWKEVLLPNGASLFATVNGKSRSAQVRFGQIVSQEGVNYRSPSQWINDFSGKKSPRSAHRDVSVSFPGTFKRVKAKDLFAEAKTNKTVSRSKSAKDENDV